MSQKRVFRVCVGKGVFGETKSDFVIYGRPLIIIKTAAAPRDYHQIQHQFHHHGKGVDRGGFEGECDRAWSPAWWKNDRGGSTNEGGMEHVCASCSTMIVVVTRCRRGRRESARRGANSTLSALTRSLLWCWWSGWRCFRCYWWFWSSQRSFLVVSIVLCKVIRQSTIACPDRGLLLLRAKSHFDIHLFETLSWKSWQCRDEYRMSLHCLIALYETSMANSFKKSVAKVGWKCTTKQFYSIFSP